MPIARNTGTSASTARPRLRCAQHEVQPGEAQREVRERGTVGREVLEQPDARPSPVRPARRAPAPDPGAAPRAGRCRRGRRGRRSAAGGRRASSSTSTARSSRLAGARRRLIWVAVGDVVRRIVGDDQCRRCPAASPPRPRRCPCSLGAIGVAPGTMRILPIVLTRLDELTTSSPRLGVEREVPDQVDHLLVVDVVGLDEDAERRSRSRSRPRAVRCPGRPGCPGRST